MLTGIWWPEQCRCCHGSSNDGHPSLPQNSYLTEQIWHDGNYAHKPSAHDVCVQRKIKNISFDVQQNQLLLCGRRHGRTRQMDGCSPNAPANMSRYYSQAQQVAQGGYNAAPAPGLIVSCHITRWDWLGCGLQGLFSPMVAGGARDLLEDNQVTKIKS